MTVLENTITTSLGGAVDEEDDQVAGAKEELENNDGDLDALATAKEETKAFVHSVKLETKQHQVRMSRGYFHKQQSPGDRPTKRLERKCVICNGSHWASQCPEKQGKPTEHNGEATAHTAHSEFAT